MRIGLLGCGTVVRYCHLPALRRIRSVTVVAAADADPESLKRAGATGRMATFSRYEDVLSRNDVDAVIIALPSHLHGDVALAAADARKSIYLEKPIAATAVDAARVVDAVKRNGVRAVVGFNRRVHPLYAQAKALLTSGRVGKIQAVQASFCEPAAAGGLPEWKRSRASGGGVLLDLFSHHADLLRWFLGDEVAAVKATTTSASSEGDSARVELVMRSGTVVQGFYSFTAGLTDAIEFQGDGGILRVDRHSARLNVRIPRRGYGLRDAMIPPTADVAAWWARRLVRRSEDPSYYHALRAFAEPGHESSGALATIDDGVRSLEVVLAAEESARTNQSVAIGSP